MTLNKKKQLSIVLILMMLNVLVCNSIFGQLANIPLMTVYGESVIKVKPDYVILGLKIKKDRYTKNKEKFCSAFEVFCKNDSKIKLFDFDEKNLSESLIQIDSTFYYKEVFIKIMDLNKLDNYLLELHNLGYNDYIYFDYRITNLNDYKNQARIAAVNSAKKKAILMATELGQIIGKAHTVEDIDSENYNWYNMHHVNNTENITFKLGSDNYQIEPGYLTIISKVKVSFDLQK